MQLILSCAASELDLSSWTGMPGSYQEVHLGNSSKHHTKVIACAAQSIPAFLKKKKIQCLSSSDLYDLKSIPQVFRLQITTASFESLSFINFGKLALSQWSCLTRFCQTWEKFIRVFLTCVLSPGMPDVHVEAFHRQVFKDADCLNTSFTESWSGIALLHICHKSK